MQFQEFKKIPRLSRDVLVTEKIDGTNGQIVIMTKEKIILECEHCDYISDDFIENFCLYIHPENPHVDEEDKLYIFAGSRNRWLKIGKDSDNHGFASWVKENGVDLVMLGEGRHYGEWHGKGINRGYGLDHKRFALFNASKWVKLNISDSYQSLKLKQQYCPDCCEVVPILYEGMFNTHDIEFTLDKLRTEGSKAVPGYMNPEGICIYHTTAGQYFKKTIENDEKHKGEQ